MQRRWQQLISLFFICTFSYFQLFQSTLAQEPLPTCRYDNVLTTYQSYEDWQLTLLDTIYKLPESYAPPDLVSTSVAGLSDYKLRSLVIPDLAALIQAAKDAGVDLELQSTYRSYTYQATVFQGWVKVQGEEAALQSSARPGHSEHQLGIAMDFRSALGPPAWELADWATTPEGAWLAEHAWHYGFVMSYPKGKEEISCYLYEPWHYRYVGRETAKAVKESGLTLREWLWERQ